MAEDSKSILIADDDDLICDLLTFVLEGEGYKIITAHTVEDIIKKIKEQQPDIMLLDLTLGERSGMEVLKEIKGENMPVLMLSGYDEKQIKEAGADKFDCIKGYLVKPIMPDAVSEAVKKALAA